ncbi:hypothetical protein CLV98_105161 [Dyadobacter jejuensis]|uniref:Uncharacterized protein n=1 Tax=Dyadobacter jejuensis TaxID=1082580 RepID=A0A316AK62_9BACT|nr:hypothetical protein [Dyadobacter jejuensis]PWJ57981.1 hypothetical protein CLV98_105161 [Dyadobacter jejuensis]
MSKNQTKTTYILFPGIAMLLGWGLRGYIGGGPFGAMIPGALIGLVMSMMLNLSPRHSALVTVFAVVGIGLGGEMTYGQTLRYIRHVDTLWFGTVGTTVKGAVWGLSGGLFLAIGLLNRHIEKRTLGVGMLLFFIGMLLGFKLINDPKLIYFSDPIHKPRSESWAAIGIGAVALLIWLKIKLVARDFKVVLSFVLWGTLGGGLGFGLGGLWLFLGAQLKLVWFNNWWKMMEFSFGLIFGMALGWATWLNRAYLQDITEATEKNDHRPLWTELAVVAVMALVIFWLYPLIIEPLAASTGYAQGLISGMAHDLLRLMSNYAFIGLLLLVVAYWDHGFAWQMAITLTFCHTVIDLMVDLEGETQIATSLTSQIVFTIVTTLSVAILVARFAKRNNPLKQLMQLLIWSTMLVALLKLCTQVAWGQITTTPPTLLVSKVFFVYLVFLAASIYCAWFTIKKID